MRFSDVQDSVIVYHYTKMAHPEWNVEFITPSACAEVSLAGNTTLRVNTNEEYLQKANPSSPYVSGHEGQVSLVATLPLGGLDRTKIEDIIVDLLAVDGAVYAYKKQTLAETETVRMIAEFCDVGSAHRAVARLNGATIRVSTRIQSKDTC